MLDGKIVRVVVCDKPLSFAGKQLREDNVIPDTCYVRIYKETEIYVGGGKPVSVVDNLSGAITIHQIAPNYTDKTIYNGIGTAKIILVYCPESGTANEQRVVNGQIALHIANTFKIPKLTTSGNDIYSGDKKFCGVAGSFHTARTHIIIMSFLFNPNLVEVAKVLKDTEMTTKLASLGINTTTKAFQTKFTNAVISALDTILGCHSVLSDPVKEELIGY